MIVGPTLLVSLDNNNQIWCKCNRWMLSTFELASGQVTCIWGPPPRMTTIIAFVIVHVIGIWCSSRALDLPLKELEWHYTAAYSLDSFHPTTLVDVSGRKWNEGEPFIPQSRTSKSWYHLQSQKIGALDFIQTLLHNGSCTHTTKA